MKNQFVTLGLTAAITLAVLPVWAAETAVNTKQITDMQLSVYQQNFALVKDTRKVELPQGAATLAFEGVARQMQPESVLIEGEDIAVSEQNYEYDLLDRHNLLESAVGSTVKIARVNPANGEIITESAELLNSGGAHNVIKTSRGVTADFPGWVIVEQAAENLRTKPTFSVALTSETASPRQLTLNYLTVGINWSANYAAEVGKDNQLDLQAWVTLINNSGADYNQAEVRLVAGDVNQAQPPMLRQAMPRPMMLRASFAEAADATAAKGAVPQSLSEYYIYTLPQRTDLKNQQSKQISLFQKTGVKFSKLFRVESPLDLTWGNSDQEFENLHPDSVYKIVNNAESNLGEPLPAGTVRFYERSESGQLQFIGSAPVAQLAKGETAELSVGKAFDLYVSGKVTETQKLADKMVETSVEVSFNNAGNKPQTVEYKQNFSGSPEIVSESLPSVKDKARSLKWTVEIPAEGSVTLTYKVRVVRL